MAEWQVQEAKAELSALINASKDTPQVITRHGEPVAVVLSYAQYEALRERRSRPSLFDFLRTWPKLDVPSRDKADFGRSVEL